MNIESIDFGLKPTINLGTIQSILNYYDRSKPLHPLFTILNILVLSKRGERSPPFLAHRLLDHIVYWDNTWPLYLTQRHLHYSILRHRIPYMLSNDKM